MQVSVDKHDGERMLLEVLFAAAMLRQEGTGELIPRAESLPNRPQYEHPGGPVRPRNMNPLCHGPIHLKPASPSNADCSASRTMNATHLVRLLQPAKRWVYRTQAPARAMMLPIRDLNRIGRRPTF